MFLTDIWPVISCVLLLLLLVKIKYNNNNTEVGDNNNDEVSEFIVSYDGTS